MVRKGVKVSVTEESKKWLVKTMEVAGRQLPRKEGKRLTLEEIFEISREQGEGFSRTYILSIAGTLGKEGKLSTEIL